MQTPQSIGHDKENYIPGSSKRWNRKNRISSRRPNSRVLLQEKWDRLNPFQKLPVQQFGEQSRHYQNTSNQREGSRRISIPSSSRLGPVLKSSCEKSNRSSVEECEPLGPQGPPPAFRRPLEQAKPESDRKNNIQVVIKELKSKVRVRTREDDAIQAKGAEPSVFVQLSRDPQLVDLFPAERPKKVAEYPILKSKEPREPFSSGISIEVFEPPAAALATVARTFRNKSPTSRKFQSVQARGRGGLLGLGKGTQNGTRLAAFLQGIAKDRQGSPDSGAGKRSRIQPGRRGLQGVLRKARSYDSDPNSKSSPRCRNSCRCCSDGIPNRINLLWLEKSLRKSEVMLAELKERLFKDRQEFSRQIASLKMASAVIKRTQEMHYRNALDEFKENNRVIGNAESHFGYVTSSMHRRRSCFGSDVTTVILRLLGDNTISFLLKMVRATTTIYSYFFPRNNQG
ncbi:unnamed protein product [Agarophyton chilense]|eukprot:gb/GEZJ01000288.1/.p2 GENE.gb/GEZJ01000288.1/~~gb/GEZJ01000288.1/.p2  ORF type:complete len:455 (+),score=56.80 gb/GEZJ01000288.1/:358-1722(+)